jgi:hypothetical protein
MKLNINKVIAPAVALLLASSMSSCMSDLDKGNINPNVQSEPDVTALYSKCYACLVLEGMDGSADFTVESGKEGETVLIRTLFNANVLSSDESICWWTDGGIAEYGLNESTPSSDAIRFLYYRLITDISYCNHYLELDAAQADPTKLAEVRFIRAYLYSQMLDLFGDPSFIPAISTEMPKQAHAYNEKFDASQTYTRAQLLAMGREFLFNWVVNELKACEANLMDAQPKTDSDPNYGRVDKAAAWLMLSRMYLNAGTYLNDNGQDNPYWAEALSYAEKVINSPYALFDDSKISAQAKANGYRPYDLLFMGDNGSNGASCEAIFPLLQDGKTTKAWGGSKFFVAALWNAEMATVTGKDAGCTNAAWAGMRARPQLIEKFTNKPESFVGKTSAEIRAMNIDDRAIFWGVGKDLECFPNDATGFQHGLTSPKWSNNYSTGGTPHGTEDVDIDFFLLRKAEAYLNAAEADMHISGESSPKAKQYLDLIRSRAHATTTISNYTLNDVLDERAREFYFEGVRRTDLIRFNQFGGINVQYGWQGKGGNESYTGAPFEKFRNVYPIPSAEIMANSNLTQIDGYNEVK